MSDRKPPSQNRPGKAFSAFSARAGRDRVARRGFPGTVSKNTASVVWLSAVCVSILGMGKLTRK